MPLLIKLFNIQTNLNYLYCLVTITEQVAYKKNTKLTKNYLDWEQNLSVAKIAASNSTSSCDSKLLLMLQSDKLKAT